MKSSGRGSILIACGVLLAATVLTACSDDIKIAGSVMHAVGENADDTKVSVDTLKNFHGVSVNGKTLKQASKQLLSSETFERLNETLQDFNENTKGPVRAAIIETACQAAYSGNTNAATIQQNFVANMAAKGEPPEKQELDAAAEAAQQLHDALQSQDPGQKASVTLICYAAGFTD
jgi:hypothetical protein